jgi:hemolysin III
MENHERTQTGVARTPGEMFNAASHFAGFLLGAAALAILVTLAARRGGALHVASLSVYGASLCLLYLGSAAYHFSAWLGAPRATAVFQRLDHCVIFVLIAGSYTPVCLVVLGGGWGWSLFGVVWGLALLGVLLRLVIKKTDNPFTYSLYGIMGWIALVGIAPLARALDARGLALLAGGGVAYTAGAVLLALKRPRLWPGVFGYHELWHVFVLTGSALHFLMMLWFVVPR